MKSKINKLTAEQKLIIGLLSHDLNRKVKEDNVNVGGYHYLYQLYRHPSIIKQDIYADIHEVLRQYNQCCDTYVIGNSSTFSITTVLQDSNGEIFAKCKITPNYLIIDIL